MSPTPTPVRIARFGVFEADFQVGVLRKDGIRIKLHQQSFQILAMLLERPGLLVTREDIIKKLWPGNTFVDFDHGLNNAVNRLRDALSDSADSPRWIQTLPRRGYRFIGSVNGGDSAAPDTFSETHHSELKPMEGVSDAATKQRWNCPSRGGN